MSHGGLLVLVALQCGFLPRTGCGVSPKLDLGDAGTESAEDAELQQTIVVSTRLKNRGLRDNVEYHINGESLFKQDSGEVPVVLGLKSVESTRIRTPDSRRKTKAYPEAFLVIRNVRDDYDVYPNMANAAASWKPSSFFNSLNWMKPEESFVRRIDTYDSKKRAKENEVVREFYCRKCEEMSREVNPASPCGGVIGRRVPTHRTTTEKVRIDGKIAKLD